jgi:hypothetical protein
MRRLLQLAAVFLAFAAVSAGEVIDRVVATVNGQPILQSDWEVAMRCEAFLDQRPLRFTDSSARETLERLIDQELLRQQIRSFQLKPPDENSLRNRTAEIRSQIAGAQTDDGWSAALARYGLTQAEIDARLADQEEILRFIDARLRPTVRVDRRNVETYYQETLLPELKQKGAPPVPLSDVSQKIEEILLQRLIDSQLSDLLRDLRQQSDIRIDTAAMPAETATKQETQ